MTQVSTARRADAGVTPELLAATVAATAELLRFAAPADATLSAFFRQHRSGGRDRAFIAETAYAVLRRKRWLEALAQVCGQADAVAGADKGKAREGRGAGAGSRRKESAEAREMAVARQLVLLSLSRVRGMSKRQLEPALAQGETEWLERGARVAEPPLGLAQRLDLPDWLVERLAPRWPEAELIELARALNASAPLDLRVNGLKADRDTVLARLEADGMAATPCALAPQGIRLKGKPALQSHPLFLEGVVEVQDEGSQLLGHLLQPKRGEMVVDFCAGAGGKTLLLGALMRSTGRLYAFDVSDKRLARLKERAARAGLSNVHPACLASENDLRVKRLAGKIDRVLVDAPCSGLGTLRRNPDLKWRQTPQDILELSAKQAAILASAARLLKPGGRLVYATCSILDEENEAVVDAFLAGHPEFSRLSAQQVLAGQGIAVACGDDMHLWPHRHGTDGFYAAVLERRK